MGIFDRFKNKTKIRNETETISTSELNSWFFQGKNIDMGSDLSEITYYTCLKVLSESLGKLSVHLKDENNIKITDNDAIRLIGSRPNEFMTPSTFKQIMEYWRNHYGNAYAYLSYDKLGRLKSLVPLDPGKVKIIIDNKDILKNDTSFYYEYTNSGKKFLLKNTEVLHFKGGLSSDGIVGKSVRETLASTISGSKESQKFMNELYNRGLTANAIVKYTGDFDETRKKSLLQELTKFATDDTNQRIIPIPLGMDLVPLDLKLTDSQFYELKKYSSLQIAAAFGVKPNHLNDYSKSSYANSEMQNLTFYIDTLLFILSQYEEEMNYKMLTEEERAKGYHFEFNVATILRGDIKTQAEALNKFTTGSIYEINEARKYLGMPLLENGDVIMVNGSYVKLEDIGKAYKGGEVDEFEKNGGDEEIEI